MSEVSTEHWSKCFITQSTCFALLDDGGDIRATAMDLVSIAAAKVKYGWGKIVKCTYDGKKLIIGDEVE